jgi:hypothetical protein
VGRSLAGIECSEFTRGIEVLVGRCPGGFDPDIERRPALVPHPEHDVGVAVVENVDRVDGY